MKNQFRVVGDTTEVYIVSKGEQFVMLMDTKDLPKLEEFNSTICLDKDGYPVIKRLENKIRKTYRIGRLFMDTPRGLQVDHINRVKLDNRKCNLRNVTALVNSHNKPVKGVVFCKRDYMWSGRMTINGVKYEKWFKTKEEAIVYRKELENKFKDIIGGI